MSEITFSELSSGTKLCNGRYIIEKKIGAGGFGITYLAKHATLNKKYAIKEFFLGGYNVRNTTTNHVSLQGIEEKDFDKYRKRFIDEAQTLATLNNEAVVKVIDIFDENGTSYIVMPFVEGVTLQSWVEKNGPMKYEMAVNYIVRICEALSYIHSKNILHRDVTPDNIIVTPEQKTVLIDFGSARKFVDNKTQKHTKLLKHGYAPLEQYSEKSRKGAYTDLYSLGGVFYYILTGVRPTDATERTMERMREPHELNPKIPMSINAIIMKAMAMNSSERYQSAIELEEDILSGNMPKTIALAETTSNHYAIKYTSKNRKNIFGKNDNLIKKYAVVAFAVFAATTLLISFVRFFYVKNPSPMESDTYLLSKQEQYSIALNKLNSDNIDSLRAGVDLMDKLSREDYIPAIYQMAFTYGWYADSVSVKRKRMLGIPMDDYFMPTSDKYIYNALGLYQKITELNDSSEAEINAKATYCIALYYTSNKFIQSDYPKALYYLFQSKGWASLADDTVLLNKIDDSVEIINKKLSKTK